MNRISALYVSMVETQTGLLGAFFCQTGCLCEQNGSFVHQTEGWPGGLAFWGLNCCMYSFGCVLMHSRTSLRRMRVLSHCRFSHNSTTVQLKLWVQTEEVQLDGLPQK